MLYARQLTRGHDQRRGLDRQGEQARAQHRERRLPGREDGLARYEDAAQPVALQLAEVGEHLLLARLGLGKPLLGAGTRSLGCAGSGPCAAATVHTLAGILCQTPFLCALLFAQSVSSVIPFSGK
jgi:hypothetical protein